MVISKAAVGTLVDDLCEKEQLRTAMKESVSGGLIASGAATFGGLIGGPIGVAVGGALGGIIAAIMSSDGFKSVFSLIKSDKTSGIKETIINSVWRFLQSFSVASVAEGLKLLLSPKNWGKLVEIAIQCFMGAIFIVVKRICDKWNEPKMLKN
ncbi:hypothetical protein OTU49_004883 [Cherax quadricarinatus]|uniref:Uncharacterized protein n=1 Tax=Cherax quadricarinatus TaxID=27406 RepID=A0AAW0YKM3_CHEQU|nr:protein C19orf12 homolog [Cherax quadricarinatus]XP_053626386.1 protein C19orf12 homolog [Cherax quadricarinatus]